jgi:ATP-dependent DNA helicase DinG
MAQAVESALADRKHLIVEAGTGTGKTLAYLVPAILSGKRIVVSTGTKNLQEQLFSKDIPLPAQLRLPLEDLRRRPRSGTDRTGGSRRFPVIQAWEQTTEIGDRAEIKKLPGSERRIGQGGCP